MPRPRQPQVTATNLHGLNYLKRLQPLLQPLHDLGTQRDHAGNRRLVYDHYASLILLSFFNPIRSSLRAVQQASCLDKVQHKRGGPRTSLGALSAAARLFDPEPLQALVDELAQQALPLSAGKDAELLKGLTAVDGSLRPALPKMAWALWGDDQPRAAKRHLHFDVFQGVPTYATVTDGNGNEKKPLRAAVPPDRLYVVDRGYAEYQLFQDMIDAQSSFRGRSRENAVFAVVEERPLSAEARKAGVLRDRVVWLGCADSGAVFRQPLRLVEVATGKKDSHGRPEVLLLASDRFDLDAAWIALGDQYRWTIELFFRWLKCLLGCQQLLSTSPNGVTIQVYLALSASLRIVVWTGHPPTKRTLEMRCLYFQGWASEAEWWAHVQQLHQKKDPS